MSVRRANRYDFDHDEQKRAKHERRFVTNPRLRECRKHGLYTVDEWDRNQRCPECMDEEERRDK